MNINLLFMDSSSTDTQISSYLTFKLGEEEFAVHVSNVLNILEMTGITKVPQTPDYMMWVINLRGSVLPVIDTRLKLGMSATKVDNNTCIVVMEVNINEERTYVGGLVDKVEAVHEIGEEQIQQAPDMVRGINNNLLRGMTRVDDQFIMVLDIEKVLALDELKEISSLTSSANGQD